MRKTQDICTLYLFLALTLTSMLFACGGGSGSSPVIAQQVTPTTSTTTTTIPGGPSVSPNPPSNAEPSSPVPAAFASIAYNSEIKTYVGIATSGIIFMSSDLSTWTPSLAANSASNFNQVIFDGTQFIAIGDAGVLQTSRDGRSWFSVNTGSSDNLNNIIYSSSGYLVIGSTSILSSQNLSTWVSITTHNTITGVAFGDNQYVIGDNQGSIFTSTDGVIWNNAVTNFNTSIGPIVFSNGLFASIVGNSVITSTDGKIWTVQSSSSSSSTMFPYKSIIYGKGIWIATSTYYPMYNSTYPEAGVISISYDGVNWKQLSDNYAFGQNMDNLVFVNGSFLSLEDTNIQTSVDGLNWSVAWSYMAPEPTVQPKTRCTASNELHQSLE